MRIGHIATLVSESRMRTLTGLQPGIYTGNSPDELAGAGLRRSLPGACGGAVGPGPDVTFQ